MQKTITKITPLFFLFTIWIIFLADTGSSLFIFKLIKIIPLGDKFGHIILYGTLALCMNFIFNSKIVHFKGYRIYHGSIIVFFIALIEELSQYYFPTRNLDFFDFIANVAGILIFSFLTKMVTKRELLKKSPCVRGA